MASIERLASSVPVNRPFSAAEAAAAGVRAKDLRQWVGEGLLMHPMRGVYCWHGLPDTLDLRLAILKLVVPPDCVVTDRTAAWFWGADMALAPNDHLVTPQVSVFSPPGYRLRNGLTDAGERRLRSDDVAEIDGLRVATPLRTACDLGRLLGRDQALAAMDAVTRLGRFRLEELLVAVERYKGYRGVIQLRTLVTYVDPGAASAEESILRLRWIDAGLPRPECQIEVPSPTGGSFFLDVGLRRRRMAAEYDGAAFHTPEDAQRDAERRDWMRATEDWIIVVARRDNVHGRGQDIEQLLRAAYLRALNRPQFL